MFRRYNMIKMSKDQKFKNCQKYKKYYDSIIEYYKDNIVNTEEIYCEIHHIVPVSEGGSGELDNLIMLCPNCHKKADYGVITREELRKAQKKECDNEDLSNRPELMIAKLLGL